MFDFEAASQLLPFHVTVVDAQGETHQYDEMYLTIFDANLDAQQRFPGARRIIVNPA
jgi:hypothetical protein